MRINLMAHDVPTKTGETIDFDESVELPLAFASDIEESITVWVDLLKHRLLDLAEGRPTP
jgi:hypothetical protein